jgi:protein-tyrosine phosphatase
VTKSLNFRDCGGFFTKSGNRVKTGMLFRSASLDSVTGRNRAMILQKSIRTIIDLRPDNERRKKVVALPGIHRISIPLDADRVARKRIMPYINKRHGELHIPDAVATVYYEVVALHPESVRKLYSLLTDPDTYPVCLNCRAGKDRTGFAVALILRTLGVSDSDIIKDYLVTNDNLQPLIRRFTVPLRMVTFGLLRTKTWEAALMAFEQYLKTAFDRIDGGYGGMEGYLDFCKVPQEEQGRLREILLETSPDRVTES